MRDIPTLFHFASFFRFSLNFHRLETAHVLGRNERVCRRVCFSNAHSHRKSGTSVYSFVWSLKWIYNFAAQLNQRVDIGLCVYLYRKANCDKNGKSIFYIGKLRNVHALLRSSSRTRTLRTSRATSIVPRRDVTSSPALSVKRNGNSTI